ncbi:MAG TPA: helix-turn-helix domain-containing protein [Candidatus Butyricicoccus stercorigallinarum]|nr:helix-turn-helix domain-containing protein [Candidatus Butyricicoccus stercorigallinarum]
MYKNKWENGRNNVFGLKIKQLRKAMPEHPSQRRFADMLQIAGLDVDKNAVQRIESGSRFVTDIELICIAKVLGVSYEALLDD